MMRREAKTTSVLALLAALLLTRRANADVSASDRAAADSLFNDARALTAQGKFSEACPKLAESQRLDPAPGIALYLADCYEKNGQTASAWATFNDAAAMAHAVGQGERERIANERASHLKTRVSTLTIALGVSSDPEVSVKRDGAPVRTAQLGTAIAIDPGPHRIEASMTGRKSWSITVDVGREGNAATVTIPALELAEQGAALDPRSSSGAHGTDGTGAGGRRTASFGGTQQAIGWVAAGGGVVLGLVGLAIHFVAVSKHDDAQINHCSPTCTAGGGDSENQSAEHSATASTFLMLGGGALFAGGLVVVLTAAPEDPTTAWRIAPLSVAGGVGLTVGGTL